MSAFQNNPWVQKDKESKFANNPWVKKDKEAAESKPEIKPAPKAPRKITSNPFGASDSNKDQTPAEEKKTETKLPGKLTTNPFANSESAK
jgi:hypothetical protein